MHSFEGLEIYAVVMRRVFLGVLSLVMLDWFAPSAFAAPVDARGKTIKDLSDAIPLEVLERSVGPKFFQSLLRSPINDWSIIRARVSGTRLSGARVIRGSKNPAYNSLALRSASELTLVANEPSRSTRGADSALVHLLIYQIADGEMALSFAYPEAAPGQRTKNLGTVRLSVKTNEGPWTEIKASEEKRSAAHERGRRLRRMDRMPMDAISIPGR